MQDTLKTEEQIEELADYTSTGTTLISYYIRPETDIQTCLSKIQNEKAQAKQIKSKSTRKDVSKALQLIYTQLQGFTTIPPTGLSIFAGKPTEIDSAIVKTVVPPTKLNTSVYKCKNTFYLDPLRQLLSSDETFGVILVDSNKAIIASIHGSSITVHETLQSQVHGKHSKGGQSQQRFERRRTEQLHNFFKSVADSATQFFDTDPNSLSGMLLGGPKHTREQFKSGEYLHYVLQQNIIYQDSVSIINKNGVQELVQKAESAIQNTQISQEISLVTDFMQEITSNTAVYGYEETYKAAKYGAIRHLILSKRSVKDSNSDIQKLREKVEEYDGEITIIECNSEKGSQFDSVFTGIGAILRYQIN